MTTELWKSDKTTTGTVIVKDFQKSNNNDYNDGLMNVNGTMYVVVWTDTNGRELWKSDGTVDGTVMVKDIVIGSGSSIDFLYSIHFNNILYFVANNNLNGSELWKSDGTAAGTVMVKDIAPGSGSSISYPYFTNVNGTLYFVADNGTNGTELWKYVPCNVTATITAGGTLTFCQGDSVTLTANTGASYLWSTGAKTQSIIVKASGNYTVMVNDTGSCSATSLAKTVKVNALPTATITANGALTFCQGDSVQLTASSASSYLWSNNATTQNIIVKSTGNYSVKVTDANGCSATSTPTTVTVNPLPTAAITAGGALTFCQGDSVKLTASTGSSYLWSNNATTQNIIVKSSGNYTVKVTDSKGCSAISTATTVTVNPLPTATITASGAITFCQGDSVQLTASLSSSYLWSNNAITQNIIVKSSGNYTVKVTDANGCSATSKTVTTNVSTTPTITAGSITSFCENDSVKLTASNGTSYLWSNNATTQNIDVKSSGSYTVKVTDANGCIATSVATAVKVNTLPNAIITAGGAITFCQGDSVQLTASVGSSYLWSNNATTQNIIVKSAGDYTVKVMDANGCSDTSTATIVMVNTLPTATITAGGVLTFCQGDSVTLTASTGSSYLWSNNASTQSIIAKSSGNYTVKVTDANGCAATSKPTVVTVNTPPEIPVITKIGSALTSSVTSGNQWYLNGDKITEAVSQSYTPPQNGNYTVKVTDSNGCSATSAAFNYTGVGISEAATNNALSIFPNPNTGTFTLTLETVHQEDVQVKVFNVLGELVYASHEGNVKGNYSKEINLQQPTGVYFVQLQMGDNVYTKRVVIQE